LQKISELEHEVAYLKAWETEKQRYELKDVADRSGSFTYIIKKEMQGSEPLHCLCANCYERGQKSIMQTTSDLIARHRSWICPSCKNVILMGWWPPYGYPGSKAPDPMTS
jgi:hypothetical protein